LSLATDELYSQYKPLLFSLAYRMTGSASDAEDVVHDVFLQWESRPAEVRSIQHPKAYLCRMTVNRCTDLMKSARTRRETYVGPWLPEPLAIDPSSDPQINVERDETLSFAMLLLMERLTSLERAIFLLREAFGYEYSEIALMVDKSEANCRKLMSRLRTKLAGASASAAIDSSMASRLLSVFSLAASTGNLAPLMESLAPDVVLLSDGGGKRMAALHPIVSKERVSAFLGGLLSKYGKALTQGKISYKPIAANGGLALAVFEQEEGEGVTSLFAFDLNNEGLLSNIYIVRNPDKLKFITKQLQ
jgi:RNA polymerase sigma-70 factor, ECF subfamily